MKTKSRFTLRAMHHLVLAIYLSLLAPTALLQAVSTFTPTGSMIAGRGEPSTTVLQNGKVLVAGGFGPGSVSLASAEVYDPATGTWSPTGGMASIRYGHTATLLPSGKVLVAGGYTGSASLSAAEIYDPATGVWTPTAPMVAARRIHTATLLSTGKVLVAGGYDGVSDLGSAELYDPATGTWSPTGALITKRYLATATLLPNGKVLMSSGYSETAGMASNASAELYDPTTGVWTATGSLNISRYYHSAVLLPNGTVLAAGGYNTAAGYQASAEIYDPSVGTWSPTGSLATRRYYFGMTLLPNGKAMAVAGYNDLSFFISSVETYDPGTGIWSSAGSMANVRAGFAAVMMPNGKVLAAGGATPGGVLSGAEVYDPAVGSWGGTGSLSTPRLDHSATLLPGGRVLVTGGGNGGSTSVFSSAELYDPVGGGWTATGSLTNARRFHTANLLPNGQVLVAGGEGVGSSVLNSAELYNSNSGSWSVTGSLLSSRRQHTATLLANGKILVCGGFTVAPFTPLNSAEIYDPATGIWSATGSLNNARYDHVAILLPNGKVLAAGGAGLASAELYDPVTGAWTLVGAMTEQRQGPAGVRLPNGKVLVAGGDGPGGHRSSTELYDPITGIWSATGALHHARSDKTITLLLNGKVLVTGGWNGTIMNNAELYDPEFGNWTEIAPLPIERQRHTATLLPTGQVVIAGGWGNARIPLGPCVLFDIGLGFSPAWRPQITSINSPLGLDGNLILRGTRFRGISGASGGNYMDGSTNYPVVQFRSLESEQTAFLLPLANPGWTDTSFVSVPITGFSPGFFLATVFTNGSPSTSAIVRIAKPEAASSSLGDVVTAGNAPDASGTVSIGAFDVLRRGGFLAENGNIVFPGNLLIGSGTPPVTLSPSTFMGLWKDDGTGAKLFARSGDAAPETGGALFDVLPQVPAINDSGEVTFLASLVVGSGSPATIVDNDTGLWSELGGTGTGILIREGDTIPGLAPLQVGAFASGCYATAHTGASTGEAAFSITMKNGSTDTAILRTSITGPTVTAVQVVARENNSAPGTAELFGNLAGTYTDSMRMDATGNLAFVALTKTSKESLWYQPVGGATAKVFLAAETAPGTSGATFKNIKSPAIGSGGVISFRGLLNNDGDNAAGLKNDGIWRGTGSNAASYACILRRGDTGATVAGLPAGSLVGNLWNSWLTNANHGAWKGWLDVDGNGTSAAPTDVYAIYSDLSGTMSYVLKVGDTAPGIAGATFASFDLPVVGGTEQMAFIGIVTGGGTTGANNSGIWRSAPNGGALTLVIRTGGTVTTTQGVKTIKKVDFPGSGTTDRRWEQPVMDSTGRLIILVTFTDGSTSQVLAP